MAKKGNPIRKAGKMLGSTGAILLKTGPVSVPLLIALKDAQSGNFKGALSTFSYEAVGYSIDRGEFDVGKFTRNAVRDGAMIGGGMLLSWLNRKI